MVRSTLDGHHHAACCHPIFDPLPSAEALQDDAHIFCLPTQIESEILGVLDLTEKLLSQFGFQEFEASVLLLCTALRPAGMPTRAHSHHTAAGQPVHQARQVCGVGGDLGPGRAGAEVGVAAQGGRCTALRMVIEGAFAMHMARKLPRQAYQPACGLLSCRGGRLKKTLGAEPSTAPRLTSRFAMPSAGSGSAPLCRQGVGAHGVEYILPVRDACPTLCLLDMCHLHRACLQLDFNLPERFDMFYIRWGRAAVVGGGLFPWDGVSANLPVLTAPPLSCQ